MILRDDNPLARKARTKSSCVTPTMPVRRNLAITANPYSERVNAGRRMCDAHDTGDFEKDTYPRAGRTLSSTAKMKTSMVATQIPGAEIANETNPNRPLSVLLPGLSPCRIPSGIPMAIVKNSAARASEAVTGKRWTISPATERCDEYEIPSFPWSTSSSQYQYRTGAAVLTCISACILAICSGVALAPANP